MDTPTNLTAFVPDGSTVTTNLDGSINVVPPDGWMYIGYDSGGNYQEEAIGAGICVSCICLVYPGAGCLPVYYEKSVGCQPQSGCTLCDIFSSAIVSGNSYSSGGFINTLATAQIIELTDSFPAPFDAMNDSTLVQSTMDAYIESVYGGATPPDTPIVDGVITAPDGYVLAFVNILGRAVMIPVPSDVFDEENDAGGTQFSCSCTSGTCVLHQDGSYVVTCIGVCTGICTLCAGDAIGETTYSADCYLF